MRGGSHLSDGVNHANAYSDANTNANTDSHSNRYSHRDTFCDADLCTWRYARAVDGGRCLSLHSVWSGGG